MNAADHNGGSDGGVEEVVVVAVEPAELKHTQATMVSIDVFASQSKDAS